MSIDRRASRWLTLGRTGALCVLAVAWPSSAGAELPAAEQREWGLVTVAEKCTGTLLNQYWVLTADHCLATDRLQGGPARPLAQIKIAAAWRSNTVKPTRSVRFSESNDLDVALLFLGGGDFGKSSTRLIYHNEVEPSMTLAKLSAYGTYYFSPHTRDDQYIGSGRFGGSTNRDEYGGLPDYVTGAGGVLLSIASVTSQCTEVWTWVDCHSSTLFAIRDDILQRIKEKPPEVVASPPLDKDKVFRTPGTGGVKVPSPPLDKDKAFRTPGTGATTYISSVSDRPDAIVHGSFTGAWATVTSSGRYTMNLTQTGDGVKGSYTSADGGITGTIDGHIRPRNALLIGARIPAVLAYRWTEGSGTGSGTFTLSPDGKSFEGWWNSSDDPKVAQNSWNGTRKP